MLTTTSRVSTEEELKWVDHLLLAYLLDLLDLDMYYSLYRRFGSRSEIGGITHRARAHGECRVLEPIFIRGEGRRLLALPREGRGAGLSGHQVYRGSGGYDANPDETEDSEGFLQNIAHRSYVVSCL